MANLASIRRVLSRRNTAVFYGASMTCWTGIWIQQIAVDWLAWELTHSPLWVGILAFCNLAPSVIVSPFAGAIADRMDRVRLTQITQLVVAVHSALLILLVVTGWIRIEILAVLAVFTGISGSFAQPARQSLVPGMVPREDLPAAVAINSLTITSSKALNTAGRFIVTWATPGRRVLSTRVWRFTGSAMISRSPSANDLHA